MKLVIAISGGVMFLLVSLVLATASLPPVPEF